MPAVRQSASLDALLGALESVLLSATGLPKSFVAEWYAASRPRYECDRCCTYRLAAQRPAARPGAGRNAWPNAVAVEVTLYSRLALDRPGHDEKWSRDANRGHVVIVQRIINALQGKHLFSGYDAAGNPDGQPLTVAAVFMLDADGPEKAPADDKADPGWGKSVLPFAVPSVIALDAAA